MTPENLIGMAGPLVSLPDVCIRVNEMIDDPTCFAEDIGAVISQDTALSAKLLSVVNSAFYGFPGRIDTLSRAITVVGTKDLRDLAIMSTACEMFTGIPPDLVNMETFWRYSIVCGVTARALAQKCGVLHPERLFVMGVLHDIGRLLMLKECPVECRDIMLMSNAQEDLLPAAEKEILGFTHCDVGSLLAERWGLPDTIRATIQHHHHPEACKSFPLENALVHIGVVVADILIWDGDLMALESKVNSSAWRITGLTSQECIALVQQHTDEIRELYGILMGNDTAVRARM